ncbi:uncharacterized protein PF3D7_1120000-like isoform X3 [Periplaneta americana]|uniref:uncharacterized protein PF3D7_1120000-like isoform X3 n=1 Tax=Periplaneta americana TaxID=6978 RepID=UPI0037E91F26
MEVIKMEREIDPLALERSNNTDIEEQKPLSGEGNVLALQVTGIKRECLDRSYDVQTEMTFDETPLRVDFPVVKSEVEEENVLDLQMTQLKSEYVDKSCDLKSEVTFDETPVPIDFPIVKSEIEEEARELNKVKEEVKLEVTEDEDEVFTERNGFPWMSM